MTPSQPRYEDLELEVEREYRRLSGQNLPPRAPASPWERQRSRRRPNWGCIAVLSGIVAFWVVAAFVWVSFR